MIFQMAAMNAYGKVYTVVEDIYKDILNKMTSIAIQFILLRLKKIMIHAVSHLISSGILEEQILLKLGVIN